MQLRQSQIAADRPKCRNNPAHPVHRHGRYERYVNCNDAQKESVCRFLCLPCGRTMSVLPDGRLPYRPVSTPQVQDHFDARATGQLPPQATQKETGCLNRAWTRFRQRADALLCVLGQMIEAVKPSPAQLWNQLRKSYDLPAILHLLSARFKTSLLGDYRCLGAWD
jgi:hypothetical protein